MYLSPGVSIGCEAIFATIQGEVAIKICASNGAFAQRAAFRFNKPSRGEVLAPNL
jgi:hypothetical protein